MCSLFPRISFKDFLCLCQVIILFCLQKLKNQNKYLWTGKSSKDADQPAHNITNTHLYNFDPLNPQFQIVKLGLTGVYIIFDISAKT